MNTVCSLFEAIFKNGGHRISRRIVRTTLWGSLLTFLALGAITSLSMLILQHVLVKEEAVLSANVGDYLENTLLKHHMSEVTDLKAKLVGRLLQGCSRNVEFLAEKMTDILQHKTEYEGRNLPVANYKDVPRSVPYLYYTQDLIKQGISANLSAEIELSSAIAADIIRIGRHFHGSVVVASEHGYVIRMDMLGNYTGEAVLGVEPLRSNYHFKDRNWYQLTKQAQRLIFINPYIASYGSPCISISAPYYDREGFAGVVIADIEIEYMFERMQNAGMEESEFCFIMNSSGEIIVSTQKQGLFAAAEPFTDLRNNDNPDLVALAENMLAGRHGIMQVQDKVKGYCLAYAPLSDTGWSIGSGLDKTEIKESADSIAEYTLGLITDNARALQNYLFEMSMLSVLLFIIVFLPILIANIRMAKGIASPINNLTQGVQEIAAGNLSKKLYIKTDDELETLADSFNHMTERLVDYMNNLAKTTAQNERIETELAVAARIQTGILPSGHNPFPARQDFDLSALMYPAREVGGDFYDFYLADENHLVITVADVSDKGVPAALFMMIAKTLLKENMLYAGEKAQLQGVFEHTNADLVKSNDADMFVTVFSGVLDTRTGEFLYANAGHNPPLVKQDGKYRYLEKASSPIMGAIDGLSFTTSKLTLRPGDKILLYTDGVTEARNDQRDFFGDDRLIAVVQNRADGESAEYDIKEVYASVRSFVGGAIQSDDITMLELVYRGLPQTC